MITTWYILMRFLSYFTALPLDWTIWSAFLGEHQSHLSALCTHGGQSAAAYPPWSVSHWGSLLSQAGQMWTCHSKPKPWPSQHTLSVQPPIPPSPHPRSYCPATASWVPHCTTHFFSISPVHFCLLGQVCLTRWFVILFHSDHFFVMLFCQHRYWVARYALFKTSSQNQPGRLSTMFTEMLNVY